MNRKLLPMFFPKCFRVSGLMCKFFEFICGLRGQIRVQFYSFAYEYIVFLTPFIERLIHSPMCVPGSPGLLPLFSYCE